MEVALKLIDLDLPALLVQGPAFLRSADTVRVQLRAGEPKANGGFPWAGPVQEVKIAMTGERVTHLNAADAVAPGVEGRRKDGDSELSRQNGDNSPGDSTLGGHADRVDPLAGIVVHAARAHDA